MSRLLRDIFIALIPALIVLILRRIYPAPELPLKSFFFIIVVSPLAEELLFRGVFQEFLIGKIGKVRANLIVSTVFALCHLMFVRQPSRLLTFFPSLVFGEHYNRHRSIPAVFLIHAVYNAVWLI